MTKINFYFTQQDPNYRIKGSRDPLGFQRIWQQVGSQLIKHLSTVSSNIRDFQILALAWYFWADRDARYFLPFFLKFEQACGFTRGIFFPGEGFNGVEFVSKNKDNTTIICSLKNQHTLMSNQRAYGIFGKYNRPFTDIGLVKDEAFRPLMEKVIGQTDRRAVERLAEDLINREETEVNLDTLEILKPLLEKLSPDEKVFYRRHLLLIKEPEHIQNEFYQILKNKPALLEGKFNLQPFLQELLREPISDRLKKVLFEIRQTEKVLYTYDIIFRTLQTESVWTEEKLLNYPLFQSIPKPLDYVFEQPELNGLNDQLGSPLQELVYQIIKRNGDISQRRNHSAPWMEFDERKKKVNVYYSEGKAAGSGFSPDTEYSNPYFIETYLNLFRQIELNP